MSVGEAETGTPRPLIVVDVDEVVVHFIGPLIGFLDRRGYRLDLVSFRLTGNIKYAGTQRTVGKDEVAELLQAFFDEEIHAQPVVDLAAATLAALAEFAEILLLTNAPHRHGDTRRESLARSGVVWPLITNDGPKGSAVADLVSRRDPDERGLTVVFIDDSPVNLTSVRDRVPTATLIHFVADPTLLALAPDVPGVALKTGSWAEVGDFVGRVLGAASG